MGGLGGFPLESWDLYDLSFRWPLAVYHRCFRDFSPALDSALSADFYFTRVPLPEEGDTFELLIKGSKLAFCKVEFPKEL